MTPNSYAGWWFARWAPQGIGWSRRGTGSKDSPPGARPPRVGHLRRQHATHERSGTPRGRSSGARRPSVPDADHRSRSCGHCCCESRRRARLDPEAVPSRLGPRRGAEASRALASAARRESHALHGRCNRSTLCFMADVDVLAGARRGVPRVSAGLKERTGASHDDRTGAPPGTSPRASPGP